MGFPGRGERTPPGGRSAWCSPLLSPFGLESVTVFDPAPLCASSSQQPACGFPAVIFRSRLQLLQKSPSAGVPLGIFHIPPHYVVEDATAQRKPPEVRIWTLRNQARVGSWGKPNILVTRCNKA